MARKWLAMGTFGLILTSCSARSKEENEKYIDYLASLVVAYRDRHGSLPDTFEQAHNDSGVSLRNRGDRYGGSLAYHKCGDRGFMFRAYGKNRTDDLGLGDDIDVYYLDRNRVTREVFVAYLKTEDHGHSWKVLCILFE